MQPRRLLALLRSITGTTTMRFKRDESDQLYPLLLYMFSWNASIIGIIGSDKPNNMVLNDVDIVPSNTTHN
jgi:hypothetical protein